MEGRALGGLKPVSSAPRVANVHPNITPSPRVPQLSVRGKNRKELLGGFLRNVVKSADEALITSMSGLKEVDDFFEPKRTSLLEYHTCIEDTYLRAGRVMHSHKCLADDYFPISSALSSLGGTQEINQLRKSVFKLAELFEGACECQVLACLLFEQEP
nr:PREDICTED: LOW QUALITY PROTEIN: sorting nexin-32 [Rhinolophus sinicus]